MDLSKTVACTALVLVVVLAAGHALAQGTLSERERERQEQFMRECTIKPVMSDAEIDRCRIAHRR
ncbi:MAG TPA: hypothetical protein VFZ81_04080 [Burkholderiales bacterium]